MKLLVIGGTRFLGLHTVQAALAREHEVTLFNRGRSNPDIFPDIEKLTGDRDGGLDVLRGRTWDAVIDTCGYVPRVVRASAELLADAVEHYTFVSTLSVYTDWTVPGIDESAELATMEDETVEEVTGETYGPLKVLCEQAVETAMPGRALVVRAGLIVGPNDVSDRFTYWPARVARGGEVLAPEGPDYRVQFIDARDLGAWMVRMTEARKAGAYNATGPDYELTLGEVLATCKDVAGSDAVFTWADKDFLAEHEVQPWTELPLWIPGEVQAVDCSKAIAAGLSFRPLAATVRDTLEWDRTRPADAERRAGLAPAKETEVLEMWQAREK
ncbi:MAG: epimerase [Anaerolineae bacterium]|nr:epimerase [Anaerolineae bacterium]